MARTPTVPARATSPGRTSPGQRGAPRERLPHERDESADAQSQSQDRIGQQAFDDATSGRADTSTAPVTDRTYRKLKGGD